jgi:hypothetical protein
MAGVDPSGVPDPSPAVAGTEHLRPARAAFARTAWREAYVGLRTADAAGELEAEDLERLAEAAWWLSDGTGSLRARERAYRKYLQRDELRAAAWAALALAEDHFHRLARSVGQGRLRRAERHLERLPDVPERGWLYRLKFVVALEAERPRRRHWVGWHAVIEHQCGTRRRGAEDTGRVRALADVCTCWEGRPVNRRLPRGDCSPYDARLGKVLIAAPRYHRLAEEEGEQQVLSSSDGAHRHAA